MQTAIPYMQLRGGSSKGLYFDAADLPADQETREPFPVARRTGHRVILEATFILRCWNPMPSRIAA